MTILFDINHPAHVYYFKNCIHRLEHKGHTVIVVSRNKDIEHELLALLNINFISRKRGASSLFGKIFYHFYAVGKLIKVIAMGKPQLIVSFMHPYGAQAAWFTRRPSIVFSDTEVARLHHRLTVPFTTEIHTPDCFQKFYGSKHHYFNSFMEMAYLSEKYFKPDSAIYDKIGIESNQKYVVVRFVSRTSVHERNNPGLSVDDKIRLVKDLSKKVRVFISSEIELPSELIPFQLKIDKHLIHHVLYYASLLIGESATMASESAMLGTPAIYIDNEGRGYTNLLEKKYGIVSNFKENSEDVKKAVVKAISILQSKTDYKAVRKQILADCIDTSEYIYEQICKLSAGKAKTKK